MDVSSELLFFFSALGAFNGLLLGLYYSFLKKPKHISNFFLGGFLICLSIRIGKSVIFYFNTDLAFSYLQFGLTACLFIGPFLYFYLRSIYGNINNLIKHWRWCYAILIPLALFVNFAFPFEHNIDLWRPSIIDGIYAIWFVFSMMTLPFIFKIIKTSRQHNSRISSQGFWDISIFIGNMLIWAAFTFCGFTSYILGALLFSFMFYLLVLLLMFNKKDDFSGKSETEKYKNKKIDKTKADQILLSLNKYLIEEKRITNPSIKLALVAKELNIPSHTLSQVLNDNLGKSFPQYLNEHRIDVAKKMLIDNQTLTLESIGYDCGFNSKSTFYLTFKKLTGMTPASFQKAQRPEK